MNREVLVTGGAGFIGSHVCDALIARGDRVVCVDNLDDFYDPAIKEANIEPLLDQPDFRYYRGDIRDTVFLAQVADRHDFDVIVHLAARAGVRPSITQPALYADVNIAGTSNLLELARHQGVARFVLASSSSVYGERTDVPFRETDPVDHPVSPYAATKKACELLGYSYHHLYGLDVSCLRFFTVYGPRQRPEMAIHKFTRLIEADEPLPLYGDGSSRRDFTYVADIVDGVLRAIDRHRGYGVFNLGNRRMVTLRELVDLIALNLEKDPQIQWLPAQPGDVSTTCADIEHSRESLGYTPATSIEDGIRKFVGWYLEQVSLVP